MVSLPPKLSLLNNGVISLLPFHAERPNSIFVLCVSFVVVMVFPAITITGIESATMARSKTRAAFEPIQDGIYLDGGFVDDYVR